mmetsp:Transcript_33018/g.49881  ORF Transcript_33018/g.49881 Transcript_33018/m.49881 type:complete len:278 (+) Transcript_33018:72-905(+)
MPLSSNSENVEKAIPDASAILSSWMARNINFDTPNKESICALKDTWDRVLSKSFLPSSKGDMWWERIVTLHSAPDRAYHTLIHLKEMIGFLALLGSSMPPLFGKDGEIIMTLSTFFHDAVYNAKSSSNEEDSARLFQEFSNDMGGFKPDYKDVQDHVVNYILATKHHKLPEITNKKNEHDNEVRECLKFFLDIDMAVLGKEEAAYLHYAGLIRREYKFVEHSIYCEKRADILEGFLNETDIYHTEIMRGALEDVARSNLLKEIDFLRKRIIPGEKGD